MDDQYSRADERPADETERRGSRRVDIRAPVTLSTTRHFEAVALDLSSSGIRILLDASIPVGSLVEVLFTVSTDDRIVRATGEIRWRSEHDGSPGDAYGIEFVRLDAGDREAIERLVDRRESDVHQ